MSIDKGNSYARKGRTLPKSAFPKKRKGKPRRFRQRTMATGLKSCHIVIHRYSGDIESILSLGWEASEVYPRDIHRTLQHFKASYIRTESEGNHSIDIWQIPMKHLKLRRMKMQLQFGFKDFAEWSGPFWGIGKSTSNLRKPDAFGRVVLPPHARAGARRRALFRAMSKQHKKWNAVFDMFGTEVPLIHPLTNEPFKGKDGKPLVKLITPVPLLEMAFPHDSLVAALNEISMETLEEPLRKDWMEGMESWMNLLLAWEKTPIALERLVNRKRDEIRNPNNPDYAFWAELESRMIVWAEKTGWKKLKEKYDEDTERPKNPFSDFIAKDSKAEPYCNVDKESQLFRDLFILDEFNPYHFDSKRYDSVESGLGI